MAKWSVSVARTTKAVDLTFTLVQLLIPVNVMMEGLRKDHSS